MLEVYVAECCDVALLVGVLVMLYLAQLVQTVLCPLVPGGGPEGG